MNITSLFKFLKSGNSGQGEFMDQVSNIILKKKVLDLSTVSHYVLKHILSWIYFIQNQVKP